MHKAEYQAVARQLSTMGSLRPSALKSTIAALRCVTFTALGWRIASVSGGGIVYACAEILLALCLYQYFVIMHECGHNSFYRSKRANTLVGTLASIGCLLPFEVWRRLHHLHHRWVGVVDMDPTQAYVLEHKTLNRLMKFLFRLIWKLRLPIPVVQFLIVVFWAEPFTARPKRGVGPFLVSFASMAFCAAPHLALIVIIGVRRYLWEFGPALLLYFVIFEYVNLPQHAGMFPHTSATHPEPVPLHEQEEITRTSRLPAWISRHFLLNFNLHSEHHLFPSAPWHALPYVESTIREVKDIRINEVPLFEFNAAMRAQDPVNLFLESMPGRKMPGENSQIERAIQD